MVDRSGMHKLQSRGDASGVPVVEGLAQARVRRGGVPEIGTWTWLRSYLASRRFSVMSSCTIRPSWTVIAIEPKRIL